MDSRRISMKIMRNKRIVYLSLLDKILRPFRNRQGLKAGFGDCLHCGDRWNWKEPHVLYLEGEHGMFPCCEECWSKLSKEEKLYYCKELIEIWIKQTPEGIEPPNLEKKLVLCEAAIIREAS